MDNAVVFVLAGGLLGVGLIGGALYGFSTFIMAALARVPDREGIRVMQEINRTVFHPMFMGVFFVTVPVSLASVVLGVLNTDEGWAPGAIVGGLGYFLGLFVVTAAGNVPLNTKLEGVDPEGDPAFWRAYQASWTRWNHVRSASAVVSMLGYAWALWAV